MLRISKRFNKSIDWIVTGREVDLDVLLSEEQKVLLRNYEKLNISDKEKVKFFMEISLINLHPASFYNQIYSDSETENLVREIPVIGYVAAGSPILALENNLSFIPPINNLI
jgi:SOS-response transcriptional repressor LexA